MGPVPAVAAVRLAVRTALSDLAPGQLVLVACSGGADSLALAAATARVAPALRLPAGGITIDHGLQEGSAARAAAVVRTLLDLGLDPGAALPVVVGSAGGPEAAARTARYAALTATAERLGAAAVLLGHTRDDQAETVLLGLARGSGARSLAGMRPVSGLYRRPLLDLDRATLRTACAAEGYLPWDDPHNTDPAYARARVRHRVLPTLEAELGPGVAPALARTARSLQDDADALDTWARRELDQSADPDGYDVDRLAALPRAVRRRVLRLAALAAGCPAGGLAAVHVDAMEALVCDWRGQRGVDLPAGVRATRACGRLVVARGTSAGDG